MDESSCSPRNLDPSAQEFHPTPPQNSTFVTPLAYFSPLPFLPPPPQLFIPYPVPPPPPAVYFHSPPTPLPPPPGYIHPNLPPSPPPASAGSPSRSLLLTSVPPHVTETTLRADVEVFGEVRAVEMERAYEGVVTVHFYDLRDSQAALREIRAQHMHQRSRIGALYDNPQFTCDSAFLLPAPFPAPGLIAGCAVWAQFIIPVMLDCVPDGYNHGTIVLFNLDFNTSPETLKRIFEAFGLVKEVRETPLKRHQKFVEFYDVRHAAQAAREMSGKIIQGKQITIDFSRPGGHGRRWGNNSSGHTSDPWYQSKFRHQQSAPAALQSSRKPARNNCTSLKNNIFPAVTDTAAPRSLPCQARRPRNTTTATSDNNNGSRSCSGISNGGNGTVEDSMSSSGNADESSCVDHPNDAVPAKVTDRKNVAGIKFSSGAGAGIRIRAGKNRNKGLESRFLIREDVITDCGDSRTTVMIKNIPNKYSQKLLLSMLDNHCAHCNDKILSGGGGDRACLSSYDFVYLPMDFNNKCNVGYGFVNMTSPEATMRLYKAFHLQSWEVFNSRKICEVTYARVQGLAALKEHFRNSKFPSGSDEIFPVVFEPARDGRRQMTPPQAIYGLAASSENGSSTVGSDEQWHGSQMGSEGRADGVEEESAALCLQTDVTEVEDNKNSGGAEVVGTRKNVQQGN
uniref:RRM domain-containing protein n=1 Tax=Kalanchoe fedtschenkoi TaxID=63787 RepID=A0A7N0UVQ3_KALFE